MKPKLKRNDVVEIIWSDACSGKSINTLRLEEKEPDYFLSERKTYGLFFKENEKAVIILLGESENESCDFFCIPIKTILKINILRKGK